MSSSRPSDRGPIARAMALVVALALSGCQDDLADPTAGTVTVEISSAAAGGFEGASIYWGDRLLVESAQQPRYEFHLPPGPQRLRVAKACASLFPSAEQTVEVAIGRGQTLRWDVRLGGAIQVTSTPPGAEVLLDGEATGRATPTTLECVAPGPHEVEARFVGARAIPEPRVTVEVGDQVAQVDFEFTPLPQDMRVVTELFTATLCPNCPIADGAAKVLHDEAALRERGYFSAQVHTRWGGTDPFANATTIARDAVFQAERNGMPVAFFNAGSNFLRGAGNQGIPALTDAYRQRVEAILGTPAPVSLYWLEATHDAGVSIDGRIRLFLLRPLAEIGGGDASRLELVAFYTKDALTTFVQGHGDETFFNVVREIQPLGLLSDFGVDAEGETLDREVSFSLAADTRWSEARLSVVVYLHDLDSKAILQSAALDLF